MPFLEALESLTGLPEWKIAPRPGERADSALEAYGREEFARLSRPQRPTSPGTVVTGTEEGTSDGEGMPTRD